MLKPGERAKYLEKKLFPQWEKVRDSGRKRTPPPDKELCELFEFFGHALTIEYLKSEILITAPPPLPDFSWGQWFVWFGERSAEWHDIHREHWYLAEIVMIPALGCGDLNGPTKPNLPKLQQGAREYAALRAHYNDWRARIDSAALPEPIAAFWLELREFSSYLPNNLEPLPQNIARHVKLRRANGAWDAELLHTLLCGKLPDIVAFNLIRDEFWEKCKVIARAECERLGLPWKE